MNAATRELAASLEWAEPDVREQWANIWIRFEKSTKAHEKRMFEIAGEPIKAHPELKNIIRKELLEMEFDGDANTVISLTRAPTAAIQLARRAMEAAIAGDTARIQGEFGKEIQTITTEIAQLVRKRDALVAARETAISARKTIRRHEASELVKPHVAAIESVEETFVASHSTDEYYDAVSKAVDAIIAKYTKCNTH